LGFRRFATPYRQFIADVTACFDISKVSGVSVQVSAPPPAKKTAGLIERETVKKRISNIE
jgi:hypothetical protein